MGSKPVTAQSLLDLCNTLPDPSNTPVVIVVNTEPAANATSVTVNLDGAVQLTVTIGHT